jgi:dihydroxycyclohexadiene carboxylate dehydrogenase
MTKEPMAPFPGRFAGKTAVVTGAGQGIGKAVGLRMAAEGATVILIDRAPTVEAVCDEALAAGHKAHALRADMEQWEAVEAVMAQARGLTGRVDVLVNNVGGTIWAKPFEYYTPEQITAEINRSLYPTLWGCRAVLPFMIEQGGGAIVNVSSIATRGMMRVPYGAAKGGVNVITVNLAMENAERGIRVNGVAAGGTEAPPRIVPRNTNPQSEQEKAWYQVLIDQTVQSSLMKRYGTVDEQAAAILFLASDEASYITGVTIPVGGGDTG